MSDQPDIVSLLDAAVNGDDSALRQLLFMHHAKLIAVVTPMIGEKLKSLVSPEDIVQEAFTCAFQQIGDFRFQGDQSFFGWLRSIAANRVRDAGRHHSRLKRGGDRIRVDNLNEKQQQSAFNLMVQLSDGGRSPSGVAAVDEATQAIRAAIALLPDDQRDAVLLHCIEGLTLEETAKEMGRSTSSIRGLVQRGKKLLRNQMQNSSMWFSHR